jgi:phosphoheptose isomerase
MDLIRRLNRLDYAVLQVGAMALQALKFSGKILFCGNGGSSSDSQHLGLT